MLDGGTLEGQGDMHVFHTHMRVDGTIPKNWLHGPDLKDILGFVPSTPKPLHVYIYINLFCLISRGLSLLLQSSWWFLQVDTGVSNLCL